jgi:hypothetical protein
MAVKTKREVPKNYTEKSRERIQKKKNPNGVILVFHWLRLSGRPMALASTQRPTGMSSRGLSLGVGGPCIGLTTLPHSRADELEIPWASTSWSPKDFASLESFTLAYLTTSLSFFIAIAIFHEEKQYIFAPDTSDLVVSNIWVNAVLSDAFTFLRWDM